MNILLNHIAKNARITDAVVPGWRWAPKTPEYQVVFRALPVVRLSREPARIFPRFARHPSPSPGGLAVVGSIAVLVTTQPGSDRPFSTISPRAWGVDSQVKDEL